MSIVGYKVFFKGLKNSFDESFEIGKIYKLNGNAEWSSNGYHFCKRPEDTLRNFDSFKYDLEIALVEGSGSIRQMHDEYYGYYDMYASTEIRVIKVLSRSEIIKDVLDSKNILRMKRLIERFKLTSEELELFKGISIDVDDTISYYQLGDKEVYQRKIKKDIS